MRRLSSVAAVVVFVVVVVVVVIVVFLTGTRAVLATAFLSVCPSHAGIASK